MNTLQFPRVNEYTRTRRVSTVDEYCSLVRLEPRGRNLMAFFLHSAHARA